MFSLNTSTRTAPTWRDWVATGLMLLAAIGAFTSFVTSITLVAYFLAKGYTGWSKLRETR